MSRWAARARVLFSRETVLLGQAALLFPATAVAVRLFGFRRVIDRLGRLVPPPDEAVPAREAEDRQRRAWRLYRHALRWSPYRPNCLQRSIALWWLLRQKRLASDLRIGAQIRDGEFRAHAWVERDGRVLNDVQDIGNTYAAFNHDFTPPRLTFGDR